MGFLGLIKLPGLPGECGVAKQEGPNHCSGEWAPGDMSCSRRASVAAQSENGASPALWRPWEKPKGTTWMEGEPADKACSDF